jgi:hypothetical protein
MLVTKAILPIVVGNREISARDGLSELTCMASLETPLAPYKLWAARRKLQIEQKLARSLALPSSHCDFPLIQSLAECKQLIH